MASVVLAAVFLRARHAAVIASIYTDTGWTDILFCGWRFRRGAWRRRQRRVVQGPVVARRPASRRKTARSGQAVGRKTRMRAAPSTTRAAILMRRRRKVVNSALARRERLGAAARMV